MVNVVASFPHGFAPTFPKLGMRVVVVCVAVILKAVLRLVPRRAVLRESIADVAVTLITEFLILAKVQIVVKLVVNAMLRKRHMGRIGRVSNC